MKLELISLEETCRAFDLSPDEVLLNKKPATQDHRIARAALFWISRRAFRWTYEQVGEAYGVSLTIAHRETKWLSSFMDSTFALHLQVKVVNAALKVQERINES